MCQDNNKMEWLNASQNCICKVYEEIGIFKTLVELEGRVSHKYYLLK